MGVCFLLHLTSTDLALTFVTTRFIDLLTGASIELLRSERLGFLTLGTIYPPRYFWDFFVGVYTKTLPFPLSFWMQCVSYFHCLMMMRVQADSSLSLTIVSCLGELLITLASDGFPVEPRFNPMLMRHKTRGFGISSSSVIGSEAQTFPPVGNNLSVVKG